MGYYQVGDASLRDLKSFAAVGPTDPRGASAGACSQAGGSGIFITPNLCCYPQSNVFQTSVAEIAAVDVSTFSLVPPFHVEGP